LEILKDEKEKEEREKKKREKNRVVSEKKIYCLFNIFKYAKANE
jgi:hypothetical protein